MNDHNNVQHSLIYYFGVSLTRSSASSSTVVEIHAKFITDIRVVVV